MERTVAKAVKYIELLSGSHEVETFSMRSKRPIAFHFVMFSSKRSFVSSAEKEELDIRSPFLLPELRSTTFRRSRHLGTSLLHDMK